MFGVVRNVLRYVAAQAEKTEAEVEVLRYQLDMANATTKPAENTSNPDPYPWIDPEQMMATVDGPVKFKDIPRDATGRIDIDWLEEKCTCDTHAAKRQAKQTGGDDRERPGQYL